MADDLIDIFDEDMNLLGTAEVGRGATRRKNTWFIAYAPAENPTVAVAMVVENGMSGGGTTAPKVGEVLKTIFGEL